LLLLFYYFNYYFDCAKRSSSTQKQRSEHENYAHQRCQVYVPRPHYFDILDLAATEKGEKGGVGGGAGRYVLVTGFSGCGKSSLIANWWRSRTHVSKKEGHARGLLADTNTFIHFIGNFLFFYFCLFNIFLKFYCFISCFYYYL
jgi:hypothetical protein